MLPIWFRYMCKSTEICDETLNVVLKIFLEHTFGARFFSLLVVYIREIHGCTASIEWYTFSRTTSYFLRKWQKSPSLQTSAIMSRNDLLKDSKKKLKLEKKL